jgi:hypothetical protein
MQGRDGEHEPGAAGGPAGNAAPRRRGLRQGWWLVRPGGFPVAGGLYDRARLTVTAAQSRSGGTPAGQGRTTQRHGGGFNAQQALVPIGCAGEPDHADRRPPGHHDGGRPGPRPSTRQREERQRAPPRARHRGRDGHAVPAHRSQRDAIGFGFNGTNFTLKGAATAAASNAPQQTVTAMAVRPEPRTRWHNLTVHYSR